MLPLPGIKREKNKSKREGKKNQLAFNTECLITVAKEKFK